jgi:plastocyanin
MSRFAHFAALATIAALVGVAGPAHAEERVVIHAGYSDPDDARPYEYVRYYPRGADGQTPVKIHRGAVVEWQFDGFHSVAFLPGDDPAKHPAMLRSDELPGALALGEDWYQPSACGHGDDGPCVINNTTTFFSSGLPILDGNPFSAKIDLPEGVYRYHCTVHPTMHGKLQVVANSVIVPTQAQLDAQTAQEVAQDAAPADALVQETKAAQRIDGGTRIWTLKVGATTPDGAVSIYGYVGRNADGSAGPLRVGRNDTVEFVPSGEDTHSVTFPNDAVGGFELGPAPLPYGLGGLAIMAACDLDEPAAGAPGLPFPPAFFLGCPAGEFELQAMPWAVGPHAAPLGAVPTPATYHDSGLMFRADGPEFIRGMPANSGTHMATTFRASFPAPGTFTFGCEIHPGFMFGTITVS